MIPVLRRDGVILAPARAEGEHGEVGDAIEEVRPGDPRYAALERVAIPEGEDPYTWLPPEAR
jgi:hypothetical protein